MFGQPFLCLARQLSLLPLAPDTLESLPDRPKPQAVLTRGRILPLMQFRVPLAHDDRRRYDHTPGLPHPITVRASGFLPLAGLSATCPTAMFQTAALMGFSLSELFPHWGSDLHLWLHPLLSSAPSAPACARTNTARLQRFTPPRQPFTDVRGISP
jgi:hypothetical protein